MKTETAKSDSYTLDDGAEIAVVGGGPSGSFFSIFALEMARRLGKELKITIYDPKDFSREGPGGCNRCGGIISELMVQMLAVEGINLPDTVVQKGIDSYQLHTGVGNVRITTPDHEKRIATIYRGGGPKGIIGEEKRSFDQFLLDLAVEKGAVHEPLKIDLVEQGGQRPALFSGKKKVAEPDLVVGAFGLNRTTSRLFENLDFGYRKPQTVTAGIAEIGLDNDFIAERFGNAIHLFLLPVKDIKFAALIPKGTYVTLCILGKKMTTAKIDDFIAHPVVRKVLPGNVPLKLQCRCLPKMNIGAPKRPFADRMVMCGDCGSTRLYKDGLGAAYLMGKAAAKTAVFQGVGRKQFQEDYYPVYRSLIIDNRYGRYLYGITDLYRKHKLLTRGMLAVVRAEQEEPEKEKRLSSILWDMFTGNERYRNILPTALSLPMHLNLWKAFVKDILRREL